MRANSISDSDRVWLAADALLAIREWGQRNAVCGPRRVAVDQVELDTANTFIRRVIDLGKPYDGVWAWSQQYLVTPPSTDTVNAYRYDIRDLLLWLATRGRSPMDATPVDMQNYHAFLQQPDAVTRMMDLRTTVLAILPVRASSGAYRATTIARKFSSCRMFYGVLLSQHVVTVNPLLDIHSPASTTVPTGEARPLALSERELALYNATMMGDRPLDIRDLAISALLGNAGLRVSEIVRADDADFDPEGETPTLSIISATGERVRRISLTAPVCEALLRWRAARALMHVETPAMFVSMHWSDNGHGRGGQRITVRGVRAAIDARLTAAGIKRAGVSCHTFRQLFAIQAALTGVTGATLNRYMGYTCRVTGDMYINIAREMVTEPAQSADG